MESRNLPDFETISALTATIMLAFVIGSFIRIPETELSIALLNIFFEIRISTDLVIGVIVAGLTVTGSNWILFSHPLRKGHSNVQHWLLPGLTAWVLSISLSSDLNIFIWWSVLFAGSLFLVLVLIAEYITIDPADKNFRSAANGLTALSLALFLALLINLRSLGVRLYLLLPSVAFPVLLIAIRFLYLKLQSQDMFDRENRRTGTFAAFAIASVAGQLVTAFHFLPMSALSFGLGLVGPVYAAGIYFANLIDNRTWGRTYFEPIIVLILFWTGALLNW